MDISEHVRPAGQRRNNLSAHAATRYAVLAAGALMVATMRDPIHRPLGRVGALLVGAVALFTYVIVGTSAVMTLVVTAASLVAVPVVFFLALAIGERLLVRGQILSGSAGPLLGGRLAASSSKTADGC